MYRHISKAETHIEKACDILGLKYELTGKLGKRTKYQEEHKPQLALEVSLLEKENIQRPIVHEFPVPHNVALNDDVRLDSISFLENRKSETLFPNTEQKLILTLVQEMIVSKPQDELSYEEMKPFIDLILTQNNTWPVRAATLLLRCKLEAKHNRTIERSLQQTEEVMHCYQKAAPHPLTRIGGVYGTGLQPTWKTEAQYADLMFKLGLVKGSLDVFLKLQMWEEVIACYTALKLKHKAAEIIKQQLELAPSVKLLCWLGKSKTSLHLKIYS